MQIIRERDPIQLMSQSTIIGEGAIFWQLRCVSSCKEMSGRYTLTDQFSRWVSVGHTRQHPVTDNATNTMDGCGPEVERLTSD